MRALDAVEAVGDGTARMTGSDGNHIDFTTALFGGVVVCQQTRHEASANVLETHGTNHETTPECGDCRPFR